MLKKNDVTQIEISGMSSDGNGIGQIDGYTVFVPFSAVGDVLEIKIVKALKNYGFGIIQNIITPSADRSENTCAVYKKCGGCSFRHVDYSAELAYKKDFVKWNFKKLGNIDFPVDDTVPSPRTEGYRNKALYPVSRQDGKTVIGFYAKRSHRVQECIDCKLQPAIFVPILEEIRSFLDDENITVYDETTHQGLVRHIYLRYAEKTGEIMVCLVMNGKKLKNSNVLVERLLGTCPQIKTVVLNVNRGKDNVVMGEENIVIYGDGTITDILCGVRVKLSALSFYQVNRDAAENLYRLAADLAQLKGGEVLIDLYCGAGTIGLSMADKVKELIGVEVVAPAVENAIENAKAGGFTNARFICDDAGGAAVQLAKEGIKPDVIVVDPPRKGCSSDVLQAIEQMSPEKVVMISCNSATAARDCKDLTARGYEIKKIVPCDLFPRTSHVECVVLLCRA